LTDVVPDEEIEPAVRGLDLQPAAQALVDLACERGGQDNITVVMMLVPWGALPGQKPGRFWKGALLLLGILLLAALLIALMSMAVFTLLLPPSSTPTPTLSFLMNVYLPGG
jgi:hypothetical protein